MGARDCNPCVYTKVAKVILGSDGLESPWDDSWTLSTQSDATAGLPPSSVCERCLAASEVSRNLPRRIGPAISEFCWLHYIFDNSLIPFDFALALKV